MKKILFLDRDGTLIDDPADDFQVDRWDKFIFKPFVISSLKNILEYTGFELVMVTNQDGLGTATFPENTFWPIHNKMMEIFRGEGIEFKAVHIDKSFPEDNSPDRKPQPGMVLGYLNGDYDIKDSFVIGDRITDVQLAEKIGAKAIYFSEQQNDYAEFSTTDWRVIESYFTRNPRKSSVLRKTKETEISVELNIDGSGITNINTGVGFFDHMLEQVGRHGGCDLSIEVKGDLKVDEHHTVEDTAIALGQAFEKCLENKRGINRYGFLLPMDDSLAQVAVDFGGRPWLVWNVEFKRDKVGDFPTELFFHFFKSFSDNAKCNLNIKSEGDNEHHKIESVFKAFAKSIKMAVKINESDRNALPSTKGIL